MLWKIYLNELPNEFKPEYYYWAAIRAEIARGNAKNPRLVKMKDMILKFVWKSKPEAQGDPVDKVSSREDARLVKVHRQKMGWFKAVGWFAKKALGKDNSKEF